MKKTTISMLVVSVLSAACASNEVKPVATVAPPPPAPKVLTATEATVAGVPSWFVAPPADTEQHMFVAGTAVSRDLSMAVQKATLDAQAKVAEHIRADVDSYIKSHTQDVNGAFNENVERVVRKLTSEVQVSRGVPVQKVVLPEGNTFRVYVQMRYPAPNVDRAVQALNGYEGATTREKALEQELDARKNELKAERKRSVEAKVSTPSGASASLAVKSEPVVAPVADASGIIVRGVEASPNSKPLNIGDDAKEER